MGAAGLCGGHYTRAEKEGRSHRRIGLLQWQSRGRCIRLRVFTRYQCWNARSPKVELEKRVLKETLNP
jgi:hypothetical protein